MFERLEYSRQIRELFHVTARLKQPDTAHHDWADCKFTMKQLAQRRTAGNDIAPRLFGNDIGAEFCGGRLKRFLLDQADGLIGAIRGRP